MNKSAPRSTDSQKLNRYLSTLKQQMPELSARYRIKSLGIFGSYLRNEQRLRSDLDVLVDFSETPDLFALMDLERHLVNLLGVKVDLVTRKSLRGRIGERILSEVVSV